MYDVRGQGCSLLGGGCDGEFWGAGNVLSLHLGAGYIIMYFSICLFYFILKSKL